MRKESPRYDALCARLAVVFEAKRGRKSELARHLGVRPHLVTEWMLGKQPCAEYTLGILEWLAAVTEDESPAD